MAVFHMGECIRKTKQQIPLTNDEIRQLVKSRRFPIISLPRG